MAPTGKDWCRVVVTWGSFRRFSAVRVAVICLGFLGWLLCGSQKSCSHDWFVVWRLFCLLLLSIITINSNIEIPNLQLCMSTISEYCQKYKCCDEWTHIYCGLLTWGIGTTQWDDDKNVSNITSHQVLQHSTNTQKSITIVFSYQQRSKKWSSFRTSRYLQKVRWNVCG